MKRSAQIGIFATLVVAAGLYLLCVSSKGFKRRGDTIGENLVRLRWLGQSIQRYADSNGSEFEARFVGRTNDSVGVAQLLSPFSQSDSPFSNWMLDTWSQPLHFSVSTQDNACVLTLWSSGENKLNESGSGDDIKVGPWEVHRSRDQR